MPLPLNPILYAQIDDLKLTLQSTDPSGTAAQLTNPQLTQALIAASNRISVYAGGVYDSSIPSAVPPPIFYDLCLSLASYFATAMYLKQKELLLQSPTYTRYTDAMKVLQDARDGKIRLDVLTIGAIASETGIVINRIPNIFRFKDSNVRLNPLDTTIEADAPSNQWVPTWAELGGLGNEMGLGYGGAEYQG